MSSNTLSKKSFFDFPRVIQEKVFSYMTCDEKQYCLGKNYLIQDYIVFLILHKIKPNITYEYLENEIKKTNTKRVKEIISAISFSGNLSLLKMIELKYPNLFLDFKNKKSSNINPNNLFRTRNIPYFPEWNNSTIYWICLAACSSGNLKILNWIDNQYNRPKKVYTNNPFAIDKKNSYSYNFPLRTFYSPPELKQFSFNNVNSSNIIRWLNNRSGSNTETRRDYNFPLRYKSLLTIDNINLIQLKIKIYCGFNYNLYNKLLN